MIIYESQIIVMALVLVNDNFLIFSLVTQYNKTQYNCGYSVLCV